MDKIMAEIEALPRHIALDADEIARQMGSPKSANMVILGAASPFLDIEYESLQEAIRSIFRKKGDEVVQVNLDALEAGRNLAMSKMN
jgi:indolepyruvate ferredoxin oxidoreductase beta subunit